MAAKSLDQKIARILADPNCKDFILADAKDADMARGIGAPGKSPENFTKEARFRSLAEFRELIRQNVKQGLVDIMLMSASTNDLLTIQERLFENSHVTPAARANDTTDIHMASGSSYTQQPSRPFRTATIDHIMCGKVSCPPVVPGQPVPGVPGADLGLYSMTFNNDVDLDRDSLERYRDFRIEAETKGFRHFLEVFDPNACDSHCPPDIGAFLNDQIVRTLAGVVGKGRPLFLKIPWHGPRAMEDLVHYDRTLLPGILGGSAGTTFDAFSQLREARKYGARAALYGRMINAAEDQHVFIQHLRWIADSELDDAAEATRSYHAALEKIGIRPYRSLQDDLVPTLARETSYGTTAVKVDGGKPAPAPGKAAPGKPAAPSVAPVTQPKGLDGNADFAKMTPAEKVAWNLARWNKVLK